MTPSDLKGKAQTVTGLVDPAALGPTLMHEHLLIDLNPPAMRGDAPGAHVHDEPVDLCNCFRARYGQAYYRDNFRLDCADVVVAELQEMARAGGRTVVDLTVGGLQPQPTMLREMAQTSGVQIVMGCGHYVDDYQAPENADKSVGDFADEITSQILDGAWGTDVRAGIIGEIGCQSPWTDQEKRVMEGAIEAQRRTGAALNVHPGRHADQPQEVADFVKARGGPLERLVISHIDRTIFDADRLLKLAQTGCIVEFDLFGWEETNYFPNPAIDMPNDGMRLKWLRLLVDNGHLDQILISHDICTKGRLERFGGHGYQHIFANVVPLMARRGFTDDQIDTILVKTPRRLLTFV